MLKSSASIGCTKRQISIVSCHIFPVGEVRQKQWLASLKRVNPPACPEHYALEDYSAVFALDYSQSLSLQVKANYGRGHDLPS